MHIETLEEAKLLGFELDGGFRSYTITGYNGDAKELVFPSTIGNRRVRGVSERALIGTELTEIIIPNGYTEFDQSNLMNCDLRVTLPSSVVELGDSQPLYSLTSTVRAQANSYVKRELFVSKGVEVVDSLTSIETIIDGMLHRLISPCRKFISIGFNDEYSPYAWVRIEELLKGYLGQWELTIYAKHHTDKDYRATDVTMTYLEVMNSLMDDTLNKYDERKSEVVR